MVMGRSIMKVSWNLSKLSFTKISYLFSCAIDFNDTLKTLRGVEDIEEYLLETAHTVTSISVEFDDVARSGQDHYFRWRMDFQAPKLRKGETIRTIGITQIRFNNEGKVVLHQDFWDSTAGLFEHLPVTNQIVNAVKKRL